MKWFSLSGIAEEAKRIRWPKKEDMLESFSTVLIFACFFGAFFVMFDLITALFLRMIGAGA